jgi:hypothetical protein
MNHPLYWLEKILSNHLIEDLHIFVRILFLKSSMFTCKILTQQKHRM